ncbi:TPA: hypothetical protein N0F65_012496 [Lagenidium giganteum]|uniref:Uncharacterized protein n=1 Tax=Lagenidium giganteum TaxID=4803 RepID=A0AAV2YQY4_9STRA|nr:TPA: hypothetical protein N0F65_012496 [Lagenidium giganteum]
MNCHRSGRCRPLSGKRVFGLVMRVGRGSERSGNSSVSLLRPESGKMCSVFILQQRKARISLLFVEASKSIQPFRTYL